MDNAHLAILSFATVLASLGVLACKDSGTSGTPTQPSDGPRFTPAEGIATTPLVRANTGPFDVQSRYQGFNVEIRTENHVNLFVLSQTITPGGFSGWHAHPGPVFLSMKTGTLTFYDGDDPHCRPTLYPAGTVLIEKGGHVHNVRNEGHVTAEWVVTFMLPAGASPRIEADAAGNCPF